MPRRATRRGLDVFLSHYSEVFGSRWPSLLDALKQPHPPAAMLNQFCPDAHQAVSFATTTTTTTARPVSWAPVPTFHKATAAGHGRFLSPNDAVTNCSSHGGLLPYYLLDCSSLLPVLALDVSPGQKVLDLCAAPGGKALAIAQQLLLSPEKKAGTLVANEPNGSRRHRLERVMGSYLPPAARRQVEISGKDGVAFGKSPGAFDRILCDVPCSSERHALQELDPENALAGWHGRQSLGYASKQVSLLKAAVAACRPGGRVVYSTCSISDVENDGVVANVVQKVTRNGRFGVKQVELQLPIGRPTANGWLVLPDDVGESGEAAGSGPMFVAALERQ